MGNETLGSYTVQSKLGKGHFGKTRVCETTDKYIFSIKIMEVLPEYPKNNVMANVHNFLNFQNPNILKVRQIIPLDGNCFGIVREYCSQGSLSNNLLRQKDFSHTLIEMKQIAQSIRSLHHKQMAHGNLKPNNILLKESNLYLSDLISPSFSKCLRLRSIAGTYDYYPRQFYSGTMTFASDIWALGIIFIEIYFSRSIRTLQNLTEEKPSLSRQVFPSYGLVASISHPDLQVLISRMLHAEPSERIEIGEVFAKLDEINTKQVKVLRMVALNQAEKQVDADKELDANNVQHLTVNIDFKHQNISHFAFNGGNIRRLDDGKTRLQVVSMQKIPLGIWVISLKVISYGDNNDEIAFGLTTEQRKGEKMNGDIDQGGSLAYWSNLRNKRGNLCINGEWMQEFLPYIQPEQDLFQIVCDTINRRVEWHINKKCMRVSNMPRSYWDQSLYFFAAMMGKDCAIQLFEKNKLALA